jgi:hypothetical protein
MMPTIFPSKLISQLAHHRVTVFLSGDRVRVRMPWPVERVPDPVRPLLRELKQRQDEVRTYLLALRNVRGSPVELHPARAHCIEAGGCYWVSQTDCDLAPVITVVGADAVLVGLCRERLGKGVTH